MRWLIPPTPLVKGGKQIQFENSPLEQGGGDSGGSYVTLNTYAVRPYGSPIYYLDTPMNALLKDTDGDRYSWYEAHPEIKQLLTAAVDNWENIPRSQKYILQALDHPDMTVDTMVSAFRFFFYKQRNCMARSLALRVMESIQITEALPQEWEHLEPILIERFSDPPIRLYLSSYTALGVMLARWGALQAALEISHRIHSIDEKDEFGAGILLRILNEALQDED